MPDSTRSHPRCPVCAAALAPGAPWCGQCLTPLTPDDPPQGRGREPQPTPTRGDGEPAGGGRPAQPRPALAVLSTSSRWRRGPTTFGPVGRVLVTLVLLIPYPCLWDDPAAWLFLVMWTFVVLPIALRDTWARVSLTVTPPTPPQPTRPSITPAPNPAQPPPDGP